MLSDQVGPIESFEWGRFVINGEVHSADGEGVGKDICILNGKISAWEARKGHRLEPKMVVCVLGNDIDVLVIGNGVYGRIEVPKKTMNKIKEAGVSKVIIEKTPDACKTYNRLVNQGEYVALLAHGTC